MLNSLNTGVSGLQQFQSQIDNIGNNIANVNTTGFKGSRLNFADTFGEALAGSTDGTVSSSFGSGVTSDGVSTSFKSGTLVTTQYATDLAIDGEGGFFNVLDPSSGETFATRAGNFKADSEGYLTTQSGLRVQGTTGAGGAVGDLAWTGAAAVQNGFNPNGGVYSGTEVNSDGTIVVHFDNGEKYDAGRVMLWEYDAPQELSKLGGNLYGNLTAANPAGAGAVAPGAGNTGKIRSHTLEKGNVDLTSEFSSLIVAQRAFQANARMISTSDELLQELVNLTR